MKRRERERKGAGGGGAYLDVEEAGLGHELLLAVVKRQIVRGQREGRHVRLARREAPGLHVPLQQLYVRACGMTLKQVNQCQCLNDSVQPYGEGTLTEGATVA